MRTRYDFTLYVQCLFVNLITTNVFMEETNYCNSGRKKNGGLCSAQICLTLHHLKGPKSESPSLSSGPQFPKQQRYLEGSQASPICIYGKRNMYMNMSILHWWNDTDTGKPNYSQRNLFQWLPSTIYLTWIDL